MKMVMSKCLFGFPFKITFFIPSFDKVRMNANILFGFRQHIFCSPQVVKIALQEENQDQAQTHS